LAYEEIRNEFLDKIKKLIAGCGYERYQKFGADVIKPEDFGNPLAAEKLGLKDVPLDIRIAYKIVIKDIEKLKGTMGKEANYLIGINKMLLERKLFLEEECGDYDEEIMFDATPQVVRLTKIYQELYRIFVFLVEPRGLLEQLNISRKTLNKADAKRRRHFKPQELFKLEYNIGS
jgi:hypothetical protein